MKKGLIASLIISLVMLLTLTLSACGSSSSAKSPTETGGKNTLTLTEEESGNGFACLVLDNEECYWETGVKTPTGVEEYFSIKEAPRAYIEFIPYDADGNELSVSEMTDEQILSADTKWQLRLIGDEVPDWWEEDEKYAAIALNALEEWKVALTSGETAEIIHAGPEVIKKELGVPGRVFACLLTEDGEVYWSPGVKLPSELLETNGLEADASLAQIQILSFEDNVWEMQIIGEIPEWLDGNDALMNTIWAAFDEWNAVK